MKFLVIILLSMSMLAAACQSKPQAEEKKPVTLGEQQEQLNAQLEKDPDNPDLHYRMARIHQSKKDPNEAIISLQKAIDADRENISYYLLMADLYMELGQLKSTMMTLQQASVIDDKNTDVMLKTAEIYFMFKKYKETFEFVNKALEIEPANAKAFFLKGHVHKEQGDTSKAIKNFMDAINNNPEHYNANIELGLLFASQRNPLAIDYYSNAIKIDSSKIDPYYNLGIYYQDNGMENEAIDMYKLLMEFAPDFEYAPYNIGYIMLEKLKLADEALPYFSDAIRINPNYYEAYFNRGLCYEIIGNVEMARRDYNTALRLKTNYLKAIEGLNRLDKGERMVLDQLNGQQ